MKLFRPLYLAVMALALLFAAPVARAQTTNPRLYPVFTNTITFTNMGVSNVFALSAPIRLQPGKGFSVMTLFNADSTLVTTNNGLAFAVSPDGTNYANTSPNLLNVLWTPNGTTAVYTYTNMPPSVADNAKFVKCAWYTNNNNATCMVSRLTNIFIAISQ